MLKTVVLQNIFVETDDSLMTFDQYNKSSFLNSINFFKKTKSNWPQTFEWKQYSIIRANRVTMVIWLFV